MKVAIVGTRTFDDYKLFRRIVNHILCLLNPTVEAFISGGASGADAMAERFANDYNTPIIIYKADWNQYGKAAGAIRNRKIIQECDICIAFWDGESRGTKMDIDLCETFHKPCYIVSYKEFSQQQPTLFDNEKITYYDGHKYLGPIMFNEE